jgi:hypothetical protein
MREDVVGNQYGRLIVLKEDVGFYYFSGKYQRMKRRVKCICNCGNYKTILLENLRSSHTKSCGCLKLEQLMERTAKHNLSSHVLYDVWKAMKQRCFNHFNPAYKYYGGRGITVCKQWRDDFMSFYNDMNVSYKKDLTIERINNNKEYSKENCKWATTTEQSRNKRNNRFITYKGESKILTDWAEYLNIKKSVLTNRLNKYSWSIEKAFETPARKKRLSKSNNIII